MNNRLYKFLSIFLICTLIISGSSVCVFADEAKSVSDNTVELESVSDDEEEIEEVSDDLIVEDSNTKEEAHDNDVTYESASDNCLSDNAVSNDSLSDNDISGDNISENYVPYEAVSDNEVSENSVSFDFAQISDEGIEAFEAIYEDYPVEALIYHGDTYSIRRWADAYSDEVYRAQSGEAIRLIAPELDVNGILWYKASLISNPNITGYVERYYFATQDERLLSWEEEYIDNDTKVVDEIAREGLLQEITSEDGEKSVVLCKDSGDIEALGCDVKVDNEVVLDEEELTIESLGVDETDILSFPSSYRDNLRGIKRVYPKWKFVAYNVDINWSTAVDNELKDNKSWIEGSADSSYVDKSAPKGGNWYLATRKGVSYYMDPRNALDASHIFMFEYLSYNSKYQTEENVQSMLNSTFMKGKLNDGSSKSSYTYAKTFFEIGKNLKVNPLYLAARVLQEQGSGNSGIISGSYSGYKGYYNFFNIQAIGTGDTAVKTGLSYAKSRGWDTKYKSINGGANYISSGYITEGQDTVYLQKWDFVGTPYTHQYMQNIRAPFSEAVRLYNSYSSTKIISNAQFMFKIPVFNNMTNAPDTAKKTSIKKCKITGIKDVSVKPGKVGPFTIKGYKLKYSGKTLKEGIDYVVTYKSNAKAGKAKIIFKGIGESYDGTVAKTFKIKPCSITSGKIKVFTTSGSKKLSMPYTKGGSKINIVIKAGNTTLIKGKDYKLKYSGYNGNAGKKGTVVITGKGIYKGSKTLKYSIVKSNLRNTVVTITPLEYRSAPGNYVPLISIVDSNGKALVAGTDYSPKYEYTYVNDTTVKVDGITQFKPAGSIVGDTDEVPISAEISIKITPMKNYGNTPVCYTYSI